MRRLSGHKYLRIMLLVFLTTFLYLSGLVISAVAQRSVALSEEEIEWLNNHRGKVILAPSPDWEPMENFDQNGRYTGLVAEMIHLIEKKLDFKFKIIRAETWGEVLEKAKKKEVDLISAAQVTPERELYMDWSKPFITLRTTIIVRNTLKGKLRLEEMQGMRIGVPKGYAVGEYIKTKYPELLIIDVPSGAEGLLQVSFNELDAMIMEIPNALHDIEKHQITNLRLAGDTGYQLHLAIGIRNDWPILTSIINKTLASISENEKDEIFSHWINLKPYWFYQIKTFIYIAISLVAVVFIVTITILLWTRTLKNQVLQRTEEIHLNEERLEALLELSQQSDTSIQEIIKFAFMKMVQLTHSNLGYLAFRDRDGLVFIQRASKEKIPANSDFKTIHPGLHSDYIGLWGKAVQFRRNTISNHYSQSNPKEVGIPKEFQPIYRYMNIPIISDDQIVAVVGMGNKRTDYDNSDLRQLTLLSQGMWRILQKKEAEETLKKSERQFRDLVENSPHGISIIIKGQIVYNNPRQVSLLSPFERFDDPEYDRVFSEDLDKVKAFHASLRQGKVPPFDIDFRFSYKNNHEKKETMKWVSCMVSNINYQGQEALLLNTIDITRSKELERLLIIQDKMASLGHVAAGIAHEIRNPLSGINIYHRVLKKHYNNPEKTEKIEKTLHEIKLASSKIENVIRRVMDFSKPYEPKFSKMNINQPINDALRLAGATQRRNGIMMSTDLDDHLPICMGEKQLIEEVILNLINNSADAMKSQSNLKKIHISSRSEDDTLIVRIEDSGPGIPPNAKEHIFEPFFTTKKNSTGIGLSICHRIITDHGGTLSVDSNEDQGAMFLIKIPVYKNTEDSSGRGVSS